MWKFHDSDGSSQIPRYNIIHFFTPDTNINGSQLAKMKKSIPDMSLP